MEKPYYSGENAIENRHLSPTSNNFSQKQPFHLRDHYVSGPHPNNIEVKTKKGLRSIPTQDTDAMVTLNGIQEDSPDDSMEYRGGRENYPPMSELEAVPERSIEYSEMTNKTSHLDSEIFRTRGEFDSDDRRYGRPNQTFPKEHSDWRYEPYSKTVGHLEIKVDENNQKDPGKIFMSPKYEIGNGGSMSVSHKDSNGKRIPEKEVHSTSKKHYYNHISYHDQNENGSAGYERSEASLREPPFRQTSPAELVNLARRSYGEGAYGRERQSLPDDVMKGHDRSHERSPESYNNGTMSKRLNRTDYQSENLRDMSLQDQMEITELKDRNILLENRLKNKEVIMEQMKQYQKNLVADLANAKSEVEELRREQEEAAVYKAQIGEIQGEEHILKREIEELRKNDIRKHRIISELETQVNSLKSEIVFVTNKSEAKIENLKLQLKRLEEENQSFAQERRKVDVKRDYLLQLEDSIEEEKCTMRKNLEDSFMHIQSLTSRNDELAQKVENLKRFNQEREKAYREKLDESSVENRRILEENVNQIRDEIRQQYQSKVHHYKSKVDYLLVENDNLKLELQSRPTLRKFKENEAKLATLENELEETKTHIHKDTLREPHQTHKDHHKKKGSEVTMPVKILKEIVEELEIDSLGEAIPKIRDYKSDSKFTHTVLDLVYRCSPKGSFDGKPTTKQAWKWLKAIMEEYMSLKRHDGGYDIGAEREILRIVMDFLKVKEKADVPGKLRQLIGDNGLMSKIVSKIKILHKLDWINSLSDLDKRLEQEINPKYDKNSAHYKR